MSSPSIDPDAEHDALVLGDIGVAVQHRPLHFGGASHRIDDAREFNQHAVPGRLHDAAMVLPDLRVDELAAMRFEAFERAFLVRTH